MSDVVNPANALTASRYLTIPVFYYCMTQGWIQLAALTMIVCAAIDLFDGAVARAFNCTSGFGELFDAVTDGICYAFFLIVGTAFSHISWTPIVIILGLGGLNSLFRGIYAKRAGRATNYRSFAMERCVAFVAYTGGAIVTDFHASYFVWVAAFWMLVIMAHDTKRMLFDPVPA